MSAQEVDRPSVRRSAGLGRVMVAFCGFGLGEAALWLASIVYAFERGGVNEAGSIAVAGLVFAMVVAPFAAFAGDRFRSDRALSIGLALQFATAIAAATAIWMDVPLAAYAAVISLSGAHSLTRPVVGSVLPSITSRPEELVRANVTVGVLDDVGGAVGPLVAAGLFAWADVGTVFVLFGSLAAIGAMLTWDLGLAHTAHRAVGGMDRRDLADQVIGGLRALRADDTLRSVVLAMAVGSLAIGTLDVLGVVFADERLEAGGGSVAGLLAAGLGVGSIVGSLSAGHLVGRDALRRPMVASAIALGVPIGVLAGVQQLVPAMLLFALVGFGRSLLTVAGAVALQRLAPRNLLVRIFGIHEGLTMLAMAVGALAVPVLVGRLGVGWAAAVVGGAVFTISFVAVLSVLRRLSGVPKPDPDVVERLLADPVLAPLDVLAIAALTANACEVSAPAGETIVREGDEGDRYYLVVDGELEVSVDDEIVDRIDDSSSFGEIALVRDMPRQATVVALTDVALLTIDRAAFLEAVTGHPQSRTTADQVVERYLDRT